MPDHATSAGVKTWKMWFALLGGGVAWTLHLLLAYAIAEFGCVAGWGHRMVLAISVVSWLLIAASAAMAALAAWALFIAYGIRRWSPSRSADPDDRSVVEYVANFGLVSNGLFLFIIMVQSLPILFYLSRC